MLQLMANYRRKNTSSQNAKQIQLNAVWLTAYTVIINVVSETEHARCELHQAKL